jgi:hypothetical protein
MLYQYRLSGGQYVLCEGGIPKSAPVDEISMAIDRASGTLHKHGDPAWVQQWAKTAQAQFRSVGFNEVADDLVVVTGRFPLDEINRCLDTTTYVATFYERLTKGEIKPLALDWSPEKAAATSTPSSTPTTDGEHSTSAESDESEPASPFLRFRA